MDESLVSGQGLLGPTCHPEKTCVYEKEKNWKPCLVTEVVVPNCLTSSLPKDRFKRNP